MRAAAGFGDYYYVETEALGGGDGSGEEGRGEFLEEGVLGPVYAEGDWGVGAMMYECFFQISQSNKRVSRMGKVGRGGFGGVGGGEPLEFGVAFEAIWVWILDFVLGTR